MVCVPATGEIKLAPELAELVSLIPMEGAALLALSVIS